jgi:hypothetical protein
MVVTAYRGAVLWATASLLGFPPGWLAVTVVILVAAHRVHRR